MRRLLILFFVADLALGVVAWAVLPAQVAIHFGPGGRPDAWASREVNGLLIFGVEALLFALFFFLPRLLERTPAGLINIPNRRYWLEGGRVEAARRRLTDLTDEYGAALFGLFFCVGLLTLDANLSEPVRLDQTLFLVLVGAFLLYTLLWGLRLLRSFRLPRTHRSG